MILFDIVKIENELSELEKQTIKPDFWNDKDNSNKILAKIKILKHKYTSYTKLENEIKNIEELSELLKTDFDEEMAKEIIKNTNKLQKNIEKLELETLLSGKYDSNNAIMTIHPGAGGTESQAGAEMLYRMYYRWAKKNDYTVKEVDY